MRLSANLSVALGFTGINVPVPQNEGMKTRQEPRTGRAVMGAGETFVVRYTPTKSKNNTSYGLSLDLVQYREKTGQYGVTLAVHIPHDIATRLHAA